MTLQTLKVELLKPFNLISLLIGLAGLYLAYDSIKITNATYLTYDSSIIVYNVNNPSSNLKLLFKDSLIHENIYLTEFVFWNNGDLPIMPEDVRDTVKLVLTGVNKKF